MAAKVTDIITKEQLAALRDAGFAVFHSVPTDSMIKAGLSLGEYHYHGPAEYWHRMAGESIRSQNNGDDAQ